LKDRVNGDTLAVTYKSQAGAQCLHLEARPRTIKHYLDPEDRDPFEKWLSGLRDKKAVARIDVRLRRIEETGALGDHHDVGDGVSELRFHFGPGYRVYYGEDGDDLILLTGGDKDTQARDIARAKLNWSDFLA
jgi:putative addiction module killer protein